MRFQEDVLSVDGCRSCSSLKGLEVGFGQGSVGRVPVCEQEVVRTRKEVMEKGRDNYVRYNTPGRLHRFQVNLSDRLGREEAEGCEKQRSDLSIRSARIAECEVHAPCELGGAEASSEALSPPGALVSSTSDLTVAALSRPSSKAKSAASRRWPSTSSSNSAPSSSIPSAEVLFSVT